MPRFARSGYFWAGVVTGAVVGPWAMRKFGQGMKPNIPPQP